MSLAKEGPLPALSQLANPYYSMETKALGKKCMHFAEQLRKLKRRTAVSNEIMLLLAAASYHLDPPDEFVPGLGDTCRERVGGQK